LTLCYDFVTDLLILSYTGQYLRPTEHHLSVVEFVPPTKFEQYRLLAESMGFKYSASGPLVRSSYKAGEYFMEHMIRARQNHHTISD
jgi:lipoyl synthase